MLSFGLFLQFLLSLVFKFLLFLHLDHLLIRHSSHLLVKCLGVNVCSLELGGSSLLNFLGLFARIVHLLVLFIVLRNLIRRRSSESFSQIVSGIQHKLDLLIIIRCMVLKFSLKHVVWKTGVQIPAKMTIVTPRSKVQFLNRSVVFWLREEKASEHLDFSFD